jgi:two-component system sensor histidine kinase FlrB
MTSSSPELDAQVSAGAVALPPDPAQRIEDLGRIILAYSEVTDKLQKAHERLEKTVVALTDELSEKNRLLERKNRLAALGEMAAGMAHEIRNPLGGIQLYASMLAKDLAAMPASLELVRKISGGVRRLDALVNQVLQFTREIRIQRYNADLAALIDEAMEMARPHLESRQLRWDVNGPRPLWVRVDPDLMVQAILNLLLNAAEAMEQSRGGQVTVIFDRAPGQGNASQPASNSDQSPDSGFTLCIRDGGPGIDQRILDRIFNPFFTTKDGGTGLGLAIVHRIVDAHDGAIIASNAPDAGAQFEIRM